MTAASRTEHRAPVGARLRYRFDNAMARGPLVVIAYLALLSLVVVVVAGVVAVLAGLDIADGSSESLPESIWLAMLRTVDAGTFTGDVGWTTRALTLSVTLAGLFLVSSLIGLIANAVDQKVEELQRGRGAVVETGHTLILGWSEQVPRIVAELVIANESEKRAAVVVLARGEKALMEETLRQLVPDRRTTRVVCRSGNPASPDDLTRVAVGRARSIIVVRDDDGDAGVVKAVLAVRALDPQLSNAHVVAELSAGDNARTLRSVSNGRVVTVSSDAVVAEVTAQACLQAGLTAIFTELLDFDGDELYFARVPELDGRTYGDALAGFERSAVIGVDHAGAVALNPPVDRLLGPEDRVILVAEDDSAIRFTGVETTGSGAAADARPPALPTPRRIAVVGWSAFGAKVLEELDEFLVEGSRVDVVVDADLVDPAVLDGLALEHAELRVRRGEGGPEDLFDLSAVEPPEQVIVLGYRDALSIDDADARTLLTLLGLRALWPAGGRDEVRIVGELLDQRNLVLAQPAGADDLIVSNALTSLLMAQLSERAELQAVFDDLFDAEGAVVEMRTATHLVAAGPVRFGDVVAAAAATGASAFGYRLGADGSVRVNPPKSEVVTLGPDDQIALIATAA